MALCIEALKAELQGYIAQRDQMLSSYHQLNGAIAVLQKQLRTLKEQDMRAAEQEKMAAQEKAAEQEASKQEDSPAVEDVKLDEAELAE